MSMSYKLVLLLFALSILAAFAPAESSGNYTVNLTANKFLGNYLINESGFALYYFSDDANANGLSTCIGECAAKWPPFYAEKIILPDSLRYPDFSTITRADGQKQTTLKGWPLYLYSGDKETGDVFGSELKGLWHVIDPQNLPQLF